MKKPSLWLARDRLGYVLSREKPEWHEDAELWLAGRKIIAIIRPHDFRKYIKNIHLKPGQCVGLKEIRFVPKGKVKDAEN